MPEKSRKVIYKALIRTYYFFINPVKKLYYFIFRPKTRGVKCIIEHNGYFLLTRLGYAHKKWTMPGGGVKKHETWEEGIRREVFEEVGIKLDKVEKIGEYESTKYYKRDTVVVFHSVVPTLDFKIDGIEITEAKWFLPQEFPVDRVPRVDKLLEFIAKSSNI